MTLRLTGGVLFNVLLASVKPRERKKDQLSGKKDGLSDTDVFRGLLYVMSGERRNIADDVLKTPLSNFKSCKVSDSDYVGFGNTDLARNFHEQFRLANLDQIKRAKWFLSHYFNENDESQELMAKRLIALLLLDEEISNDEHFRIQIGNFIPYSELKSVQAVSLSDLLLSIIDFIFTDRSENELGRELFLKICSQKKKRAPWRYSANIENNIPQKLSLVDSEETLGMILFTANQSNNTNQSNNAGESSTDSFYQGDKKIYIDNRTQTIVNQYGDNAIQAQVINNLVINGDKK